jgi:hypothetical protein
MLGEQDNKTNTPLQHATEWLRQPYGRRHYRHRRAWYPRVQPADRLAVPADPDDLRRLFTTTASSYLPAAFTTNLAMLAHSANKIGLSATVNEFVNAQVVVLSSAQYLGRSAGFRRRQVHPSGTGEAGRAPDSPPSYQGGRRQAE